MGLWAKKYRHSVRNVAMVLVAAVALGSSTYAWFVSNNQVTATTASISAQSNAPFLVISNAAITNSTTDTAVTTAVQDAILFPVQMVEANDAATTFKWESASFMRVHRHGYRIFAKDSADMALFVPDGKEIPIYDGMDDFTVNTVDSHKAAVFFKLDEDFVRDGAFDIEDYLINRLAKNFGRAEENACINGNGVDEPTGILDDTKGADVAVTADTLTYDTLIEQYFSVKPEYRKNAVWLMNDKTALTLRKLKDADGNYLWNSNNDTILGRPVYISEFIPDAVSGSKPIAFGDFSYYWFISRSPISLRTLTEQFAANDQVGYLALEFVEGKLIRRDAVKVISMK